MWGFLSSIFWKGTTALLDVVFCKIKYQSNCRKRTRRTRDVQLGSEGLTLSPLSSILITDMPTRPRTHQMPSSANAKRHVPRPRATARTYNWQWQKVRAMQLRHEPLCHDCQAQGYTTPATEVHHLISVRNGGTNTLSNLQSLCKMHHSQETAREKRGIQQ